MRIAIPDNNGEVNQHYGKSKAFSIIDIKNNQDIVFAESVSTDTLQHNHSGLAELLKNKGVEVVIVGGIGPGAVSGLEACGLKVLFGASGPVKNVAESFANSTFISNRVVCGNHEHGHHHDHHHHHDQC